MAFKETRENKVEGSMEGGGRVRAWESDAEPGRVSLAVVGARALMTREEALTLGKWLVRTASEGRMVCAPPAMQTQPLRDPIGVQMARTNAAQRGARY